MKFSIFLNLIPGTDWKKHRYILMSDTDYLRKKHEYWAKRIEKCIEQELSEGGHSHLKYYIPAVKIKSV